jgi:glycosyltransferase involved in cell wall biosynthesis
VKLLVLSQYFWPETFLINDVVRTLVAQGHEVTVATGKPNYPDGRVFDGYTAAGTQRERYLGKVDVVRVPLWPRGRGGARNLIINYLSFVASGLVFFPWLLRGRRFDAILVFAPSPITQAIPAILLKWLKRAPLALWVQDLWPESLSATGFVKNPRLLRAVGWVVKGIYRCCDLLLVQSCAFVEAVARYADREKIVYYPNSISNDQTSPSEELSPALRDVLDAHFCVVFAGNLGAAQGLETIVEAAVRLRNLPTLRLVLVGSGSRLAWLQAQKEALGLDNLVLPGRFPMALMPRLFERAAALLVSLNDEPIFAQTIPSKLQAYMAAGRPIIASLNGEGARVVLEADAGLTCPAGDAEALADGIRRLHALPADAREAMGAAGHQYYLTHFEIGAQCARLVEILSDQQTTAQPQKI